MLTPTLFPPSASRASLKVPALPPRSFLRDVQWLIVLAAAIGRRPSWVRHPPVNSFSSSPKAATHLVRPQAWTWESLDTSGQTQRAYFEFYHENHGVDRTDRGEQPNCKSECVIGFYCGGCATVLPCGDVQAQ
jgi:hypothetical protein